MALREGRREGVPVRLRGLIGAALALALPATAHAQDDTVFGGGALAGGTRTAAVSVALEYGDVQMDGLLRCGRRTVQVFDPGHAHIRGGAVTSGGRGRTGRVHFRWNLRLALSDQGGTGTLVIHAPGCRTTQAPVTLRRRVARLGPPAAPRPGTTYYGGDDDAVSRGILLRTAQGRVSVLWNDHFSCDVGGDAGDTFVFSRSMRVDGAGRFHRVTHRTRRIGQFTLHLSARVSGRFHRNGVTGTDSVQTVVLDPAGHHVPVDCGSPPRRWSAAAPGVRLPTPRDSRHYFHHWRAAYTSEGPATGPGHAYSGAFGPPQPLEITGGEQRLGVRFLDGSGLEVSLTIEGGPFTVGQPYTSGLHFNDAVPCAQPLTEAFRFDALQFDLRGAPREVRVHFDLECGADGSATHGDVIATGRRTLS